MKDIKIGWIGLGCRSRSFIDMVVVPQGEKITAVCNLYEDRRQEATKSIEDTSRSKPIGKKDFLELIADQNINQKK